METNYFKLQNIEHKMLNRKSNKLRNSTFRVRHSILQFICVIILSFPTTSMAQDVLIGHVVSVDRERGEFIVQITDNQKDSSELITVKKSPDEKILFLPECVEPGNFVRIWGKSSSKKDTVFQADIVRGPGLGKRDRSGIRSRINRGVGRLHGRQNHRLHKKQ